ncbi:MAG: hypothetical protein IT457_13795 [Planctomycetes bacterium]|nr:hypothetical protein [Planctomycetota bacterium]
MGSPSQALAALLRLCLVLALGLGTVRAQLEVWKLPPRGAAEYERRTSQWTVAAPAEDPKAGRRVLVRPGDAGADSWRFRQTARAGDDAFETLEFDDSAWLSGATPFGDRTQRSAWPGDRPFLEARLRFALPRRLPKSLVLQIDHDDRAQVWINGVLAYESDQYRLGVHAEVLPAAIDTLRTGENLIAVRIHNTGGASYFDCGLTGFDRAFKDREQALRLTRELDAAARRVRDGVFPGFRAGPFVCEGQLAPDRRRLASPGIDFRDLPAYLAFDLSLATNAGGFAGEARRVYRLGDVSWRGKASPPDATGLQRIEVDVQCAEPAARDDDKRFVERYVRTGDVWTHRFEGRIVIERRFDPERGAVGRFTSRIEGRMAALRGDDANRAAEFVLVEDWNLVRVRSNRDVDFEAQVAAAIRRGGEKLRAELGDLDRPPLRNQPDDAHTYNSGRLALALLAMIHADLPRNDPVLVRGMDELRRRRFNDTYSTAHAIMALEAWYAPRGELEELRSGSIDRPRVRQLNDADRQLMAAWVEILMRNVDTRVDRGYLMRWNYTGEGRYDHSVNQYGLLGLYSARLCGIEVPATVWTSAANHLIADQEKPRAELKLELTTYQQLEKLRAGGTSTGARGTNPAGWSYQSPKSESVPNPIYGSMTCAGIAGLTICLAGMRDAGLDRMDLEAAGERAVRRGFAWLAENFTVHSNADRVHQPYYWVYYYLYGLERACELSRVALINGRDWYYEGALTLLALQQGDGGWPGDHHPDEVTERTAMAVLFLKKSSTPVYTQK